MSSRWSKKIKSRDHRIRKVSSTYGEYYVISWTVDVHRGKFCDPSSRSRTTDLAGAVRFAKKWNLEIPREERK